MRGSAQQRWITERRLKAERHPQLATSPRLPPVFDEEKDELDEQAACECCGEVDCDEKGVLVKCESCGEMVHLDMLGDDRCELCDDIRDVLESRSCEPECTE